MNKPFIAILLMVVCATGSLAADYEVGRFSVGDLTGWNEKVFRGRTVYQLARDEGKTAVKAHSRKAASGLIKKLALDPEKYPVLRWSWKIEHTLPKEDVARKSGDDYAARVYVVFPGAFFWQTRAINYVWAARLPKNSAAPSPYTSNAVIVAVESGEHKAGMWVHEEQNIRADYRRLFGEEPPRLGAVAVMTDTDDTGDEVTAWYGDITLASR